MSQPLSRPAPSVPAPASPPSADAGRSKRLIRALVVDDSAFVRKIVREILTRSPYIEVVGVARDGEEALKLCEEVQPDIVTCDLMMPRLNGLGFVRAQMARRPIPILILSASPEDGGLVLEALHAGAVDFLHKPTALATDELLDIGEELVAKVIAAARAPMMNLVRPGPTGTVFSAPTEVRPGGPKVDLVMIGVSTGGPQALRLLLPQFPANFPVPIAMVLHMPVGYTALFAEKLDELSSLKVTEAREGDVFRPGIALLAPAGRHLLIRRNQEGDLIAHLSIQPIEKIHRPAVDVMFESAAETLKGRLLGVVLTGMGEDGKLGAGCIKAQGGSVITEAESTCVIYGMPRSVVEAGFSDAAIPLGAMVQAINQRI